MYKVPRQTSGEPGDTLPYAGDPPPEASHPAAAAPPEEHVAEFYALSVVLTGFDEVDLLGTGAGDLYLHWLHRVFPDTVRELLDAWRHVQRE